MPDDVPELWTFANAILHAHRVNAKVFPNLNDELERMEACLHNWRTHKVLKKAAQASRRAFWQRCRSLFCAACMDARYADEALDILERFDAATDVDAKLVPTLITFKGPCYRIEDVEACVSDSIAHWGRFASRKVFKHAVTGYVRGIEISIDHAYDIAHAEISMLALVEDDTHVQLKGGWLHLWNDAHQSAPSQKVACETPDLSTRDGMTTFLNLVNRVATVAVRPRRLCEEQPSGIVCDAWKLKTLRAALKNRKLILFGGKMRR